MGRKWFIFLEPTKRRETCLGQGPIGALVVFIRKFFDFDFRFCLDTPFGLNLVYFTKFKSKIMFALSFCLSFVGPALKPKAKNKSEDEIGSSGWPK